MYLDKYGKHTNNYVEAVWLENRITAVIYSPTIYQLLGNREDPGKHPWGLQRIEYIWKYKGKSGISFFYCYPDVNIESVLEYWSRSGWEYKLAS